MKEPTHDDERLGAMLDGRLDGPEREELLARLAASDEDFTVFADTAAVLRAAEEADAEPPPARDERVRPGLPFPLRPRPRWPRRGAAWAALAVALATLALLPVLASRLRAPSVYGPMRIADHLASRDVGLLPAWISRPHRWPASTRSAGSPLPPQARSARLGALQVDLALGVQARDSAGTVLLAEQILALLNDAPGFGSAAGPFRAILAGAGAAPERLRPLLRRAEAEVRRVADREMVVLGAWTEGARIAAARRDTGFFRRRESRAILDRAAELPALDNAARSAAGRVRAATRRADRAPDWVRLEDDLAALFGALGS